MPFDVQRQCFTTQIVINSDSLTAIISQRHVLVNKISAFKCLVEKKKKKTPSFCAQIYI